MATSADTKRVLTGVKHIYFTPWNVADTAPDSSKRYELLNIIADTTAISQDDPETTSVEAETRDEPIIESVTNGAYTVTMDSADINYDILETCLGFTKVVSSDTPIAALAPASYVKKYVMVEIEFTDTKIVLPRILLTSKIDASSLKTNVAKGTLSGTGYSASVVIGSGSTAAEAVDPPFFVTGASQVFSVSALSANAS